MKRHEKAMLVFLSVLVLIILAVLERAPGYMDADYYYATGLRIANKEGMSEPFLWNYLGKFDQIPHPSHAYWLPLASFVSAASMALLGSKSFLAGKVGFILIAAIVPLITAQLTIALGSDRKTALLAGVLACFPVFYLPFMAVTDTFGIYMLLGGMLFLLIAANSSCEKPFILGVIAGAMHLSRAEGFLWVGIVMLALFIHGARNIRPYLYAAAGYLFIFGPWIGRNLVIFGAPLGAGSVQGLWLTEYNDLFIYPATELTFQRWWSRGLKAIFQDRLWALGLNAQTFVGVQMQIFMLPLVIWGGIKKKHQLAVKLCLLALAAMIILMTVVFPFQGARGGYFHAVAALQPFVYSLAAIGFSHFIQWASRRRTWNSNQAWYVLAAGLFVLSISMSTYIVRTKVIGKKNDTLKWNQSYYRYQLIQNVLQEEGIREEDMVMINNPPGYYAVSGQKSIVIPDGDEETLLAAAAKFGADYVVVDENYPRGLKDLYAHPQDMPGLNYLQSVEGVHYFKIDSTTPEK